MDIQNRKDIRIKNKQVIIIGLGRSGVSAAKLAHSLEANVFISDQSDFDDIPKSLQELNQIGINGEAGGHSDQIYDADLWIVSPGVPRNAPIIEKAQQLNIPLAGEIEFSSWFTDAPVVAVTGSNGKTTTVHVLTEMCQTNELHGIMGGNVGIPFSKVVLDELESSDEKRVYILEISSFQMEFIHHFHPFISIFLNISPDHLDRHADMDEYVSAKLNLVTNSTDRDFIIYNADDATLANRFHSSPAQTVPFSLQQKQDIIFGLNETKIFDEEHATLINLEHIALPGRHNLANQLAAATAAHLLNVDHSRIAQVMESFAGVEHRLETAAVLDGVTYINDSKATNVDSVKVALESMTAPTLLILGGKDKGGDFTQLLPHTHNLKEVIAYGQARDQIQAALGDAVRFTSVVALKDAVALGKEHAHSGDTVLLSPGCASFDQFGNFEERGRAFKSYVQEMSGQK